ncbi:DUF7519 family protein [Haloarchaeobius sp. HRN-SO-5]|uniref:DUF7519 family protein n=1 Tax=Haloarchaeobius sp. HRN-SO-5 TaxID=3446118 RepID=UPI003EB93079
MTDLDRRPAKLSAIVALGAGALAAFTAALTASVGVLFAGFGVVALAPALLVGSRRLVHLGSGALVAGILFAGATGSGSGGATELLLLVGATASIVAWDVGQNAIGIGEQLGRDTETTRAELAHLGATVAVGTVTAGTAYGLYQVAGSGQPLAALAMMLVAVVALTSALRQ